MRPALRRRLSLALAALGPSTLTLGACQPDDPFTVDLRELGADLKDGSQPTPGGGTCEECVRDAVLRDGPNGTARLELCLDTRVRYIGRDLNPVNDVDLLTRLTDPDAPPWAVLHTDPSTDAVSVHCLSHPQPGEEPCALSVNGAPDGPFLAVTVSLVPGDEAPNVLRLAVPHSAVSPLYDRLPSLGLRVRSQPGATLDCPQGPEEVAPTASKAKAVAEGTPALVPSLAHITYPHEFGGVRSCSGVLVSPSHVLTVKHCFQADAIALDASWSDVEVRMYHAGQATLRGIKAVVLHPARDLAVVELATGVHAPHLPLPVADFGEPGCTFEAYGFGVRPVADPAVYDWAHPREVPVLLAKDYTLSPTIFPDLSAAELLLLAKPSPTSAELCRGDSGGPIVQRCGGVASVVGITFARIFHDTARVEDAVEVLSDAFSFSRGNDCGKDPLVVSVATRLEEDVLGWLSEIVEVPPPMIPGPPPLAYE